MQLYKINPLIIKLTEKVMDLWTTRLILQHSEGKIEITGVKIRHGIFQGNSLLPLRFYLALDPLSNLIDEQGHGYTRTCIKRMSKETGKETHLLYVDNLKLFAPNDEKLVELLK